jgi:hypothetical protein
MIIKGKSVAGADRLMVHLTRVDENERVDIREFRGVSSEKLRDALREMEGLAAGTRAEKPFYHASINTLASERLTDEQRARAIEELEQKLGLTGQPRVVVVHLKKDREHCHIVWSRIDLERMAAISDGHNYRKHEEVARELEREFGLTRVQGAHAERDGTPRPKRTPSHAEMLQAGRTGLTTAQVTEQVTEIWRSTDSGQAFADGLWRAGYVLARGDRRDFVVIDPMGGTHSLARRIEGARVKDVRERLADLDPAQFPNVAEAKAIQQARQKDSLRQEDEMKAKLGSGDDLSWTNRGGMVGTASAYMPHNPIYRFRWFRNGSATRRCEARRSIWTCSDRKNAGLPRGCGEIENLVEPAAPLASGDGAGPRRYSYRLQTLKLYLIFGSGIGRRHYVFGCLALWPCTFACCDGRGMQHVDVGPVARLNTRKWQPNCATDRCSHLLGCCGRPQCRSHNACDIRRRRFIPSHKARPKSRFPEQRDRSRS